MSHFLITIGKLPALAMVRRLPTHKKERAQGISGLPKSIGELFGKRRRKSKHPTGVLSDAAKFVVFRRGGDNRAPPTPLKGSPTSHFVLVRRLWRGAAGLTRAPRPSRFVPMRRVSSGGGPPASRHIKKKGHKAFQGSQKVSKNFLGKGETDVKANIRQSSVGCCEIRRVSTWWGQQDSNL